MKVTMKPVTRDFRLESDPDGEATVKIRQARTGDNIALAKLFEEQSRVWRENEDAVEVRSRWNLDLVRRKRAFLTLVGAEGILDENGEPLFRFRDGRNGPELAMSEHEFNKMWDMLPLDVTEEISEYVLIMNPQWDPALSGE